MTELLIRPFRFEDLNGKPEPEEWGPVYPFDKPSPDPLARIRALTAVTPRQGLQSRSLCASGQAGDFNLAKFRASLTAALHTAAAADRRRLAKGELKTLDRLKPREAYEAAIAAKRAREARETLAYAA